jgi:hypothetical protein
MTIPTKVHVGRKFFLQHRVFHRPVALDAMKSGFYVRRVAKEDGIWNSVDGHPGDVFTLFGRFAQLRYCGLSTVPNQYHY